MTLDPAPYHAEIAHGPDTSTCHWVKTSDEVRVRIGHWPLAKAAGTVLIFPGRTEFVEKYGQIATAFGRRGLASAAIDWRGQGLSDRLLDNPMIGHVERFTDYQKDVAALMRAARSLEFPRPYFLLAHSMGGAIGLRSLMEGMAVSAAAFSAPMWGIQMAAHLRPAAWVLSHAMPRIGRGHMLPPGSQLNHHVLVDGFKDNLLTRDRRQFEIMRDQMLQHPELSLGGPSFVWLREALRETRHLAGRPSPNLRCVTLLGSNERIVELNPVHARMKHWPAGRLQIVPDGEHEVLMESPEVTGPIFDDLTAHFLKPGRS